MTGCVLLALIPVETAIHVHDMVSDYNFREYNNYYEGEFILYSHKELPARVSLCQIYDRPTGCS